MNEKDAYEALGLDPNAPKEELDKEKEKITKAYRRMAMKHHPDRNPGNKDAEERFKHVQKAYQSLTEPQPQRAASAGGSPFEAGGGFSARGFDDLFEQMFGRQRRGFSDSRDPADEGPAGSHGRTRSPHGANIEGRVQISLKKALAGGPFSISVTRGDGKEEIVTLRLRPGVADGERLVAAGKGAPSFNGKGQPGDLVLTILVQADPVFERVGDDLIRTLQVPFARCALGGEMPVEMPDGSWVNVSIPQGASSGMKLRLRGKGAAKATVGHGDVYCRVEPTAPKKMLAKERKVWERLLALQEAADRPQD